MKKHLHVLAGAPRGQPPGAGRAQTPRYGTDEQRRGWLRNAPPRPVTPSCHAIAQRRRRGCGHSAPWLLSARRSRPSGDGPPARRWQRSGNPRAVCHCTGRRSRASRHRVELRRITQSTTVARRQFVVQSPASGCHTAVAMSLSCDVDHVLRPGRHTVANGESPRPGYSGLTDPAADHRRRCGRGPAIGFQRSTSWPLGLAFPGGS